MAGGGDMLMLDVFYFNCECWFRGDVIGKR